MNRRGQDRTGALGGSGMVGLWGASSFVTSVQQGTITVSGAASSTATITAVDMTRALIFHLGQIYNPDSSVNSQEAFVRLDLTNATTITATRQNTGNSATVQYVVIEFLPAVFRSVQRGSISLSGAQTSNTATITEVNAAKAWVTNIGYQSQDTSGYLARALQSVALTNGTTVTASRFASTFTAQVSYQVVEFF